MFGGIPDCKKAAAKSSEMEASVDNPSNTVLMSTVFRFLADGGEAGSGATCADAPGASTTVGFLATLYKWLALLT